MKLENQVCTLEQAKKLYELGGPVHTKALFIWNGGNLVAYKERHLGLESFAAFTSAELGQLLPAFMKEDYDLACYKDSMWGGWDVEYSYSKISGGIARFEDKKIYGDTEAQAKALMLIWLLESGFCKAEELQEEYAKA